MALNQLKFDQLETGSVYPITASYALSSSAGSGGTTLITGSTYPITSSWSNYSISSSYSVSSSYSFNSSTSSFSSNSTSASYSSTASVALNALTASYLNPISQSLIPSTGSTYSLGSPTNKWKDLYVSTGSIYIGETVLSTSGSTLFANSSPVVTLNTSSGQIEVAGLTASLSSSFASNAILLNNTASTVFATTGSNNFNGNQTVQGNITVVGSLIAQQYVISSSVSYFTSSNFDGSTKFGDSDSDTHQFTGSLRSPNITGSLLGTSSFSNNSTSASYSSTASVALVALTSSYINTATNAISSSFANTASISISSSFASTASYNLNSISSSYSLNSVSSSYSNVANTATSAISSSYATTAGTATSATSANNATSASYALTASFALNASGGGGGSGTVSGSANYIAKFTSGSSVGNSVIYETGSNIGIGTINPNAKLNINSSGSLVSGSVVFSVEGTQGSLFSVDDSLSGSLMSVNDISGLPILEVFSDDRLVVGTYNANTLVVTGSRVGIGTSVPVAKLQVSGNISASSFTSSVSSGVGFLGTSSFAATASFSLTASNVVTASYALNSLTASFALNASGGGGGSGTVTGSVNYISKFTTTTTVGNSVIYETGSNIGIGTTIPNSKLNINSSGSLASGSVVFSVEGTQGSLFSVDDSLSGSLMSVNDISGLPILEVFSDDRLVVGTYNSNALVVTGSRVGIGINNPVAKLQVNGNISGSSFTGSVFGTSSWATNALSASYAPGGGTTLTTGSTYPITSSWATTSSNIIGGTSNYIPLWSTNTSLGNSVLYQNSSNIGIGTTSPADKLQVAAGNISVDSGYRYYMDANIGAASIRKSGSSMVFSVGSSDRVFIDSNGGVGIGTSFAASKLDVADDLNGGHQILVRNINAGSNAYAALILKRNADVNGLVLFTNSSTRTADGGAGNSTIRTDTGKLLLGAAGTTYHAIDTNGNVGIGTTSPTARLHVTGSTGGIFEVDTIGGATTFYISASGDVGIGTISPSSLLHVNGVITFGGDTRFGVSKIYNSSIGDCFGLEQVSSVQTGLSAAATRIFTANGGSNYISLGKYTNATTFTDWLFISQSGNVGIGTTSPVAKLQVNGNISGSSFTGSVFGTSSWANNATTASFASTASYNLNSISSSYSLTASFALNGGGGGTTLTTGSTYPITSSWATNAITASYALNSAGGGGSISYITGSPVIGQYIVVSGSSTTQYTLTQSVVNPAHLLVSVNGVVQNYSSSYTVTGSTINFYQPYSDGDEIDVRFLNGGTTLQTGSIAGQTILYNFSSSQESTLTGLNLTGNKWGVNVIEEWNSGSGDIYFNSCSLLLHFDSLNSSGSFIDNSSNNFAITSSGNVSVNSYIYKFGGASGLFDGTADYLTTTSNSSFGFGTGDYTIEAWVYPTSIRNGENLIYATDVTGGTTFGFNQTQVYIGARAVAYDLQVTYTVVANVWTHLTATRQGGTVRIFANGNLISSGTVTRSCPQGPGAIGDYPSLTGNGVTGYIDEVRITKGVARYTASFTPSSFAFPNSATQIATKYIGLVGGLNDTNVDYGIEKLSDTSLKIKKLTDTQQPSGSFLSSSVDRVYVNVLNYDNVSISGSISNAVTASFAVTSSYTITSAPRTAIYRYGTTSVVNPGSYTNTIIKYDTAVTDSTGWYDNTNGRFTPTVAGWYQVSAGARVYGGSSTIEGYLGLFKNGIPNQIAAVGGQGFVNGLISLLVYFNGSTDYIQLYSNTSAAITNAQNVTTTPFTMVYMTS